MSKRFIIIPILAILVIAFVLTDGGRMLFDSNYDNKTQSGIDSSDAQNQVSQEHKPEDEALIAERNSVIEQSKMLYRGYFYDEAIQLLNANPELVNDETKSIENEIKETIDGLVLYEDNVKHIFFHSLILYPEYLFPNLSVPTGGYNEGFAYKSELEKILPQLLERGYVLYNINDIFAKDASGTMTKKDIYLPPGKIPLVLSVDDPSYHYGIGFANKMILDENGELATEVITPENEKIITYDGDVELVINNFVAEHPEFSYRGNKGIVASTGYLGIFGYDLKTEESRQQATAVCEKLKATGWLFASHSFTHNRVGFWGQDSNASNIIDDTRWWKETIEPITGFTNLFIAPFGYTLQGAAMDVIINNGYDIYCSVDDKYINEVFPAYALMSRVEIGGYALSMYTDLLNRDFFDVASVKDSHRPPISSG